MGQRTVPAGEAAPRDRLDQLLDHVTILEYRIDAILDAIHGPVTDSIYGLHEKFDDTVAAIEHIKDQVVPVVDQLQNHPMVRMFVGGKRKS